VRAGRARTPSRADEEPHGRIRDDPTPALGSRAGATDDGVDLPDGRRGERLEDVRKAPDAAQSCLPSARCSMAGRPLQHFRHRRSSP
jgi:hypothetical protein